MRIDHVVDYMKKKQTEISKMHSAQIGGRIDEIVTLLNKYTTRGLYGEFFNSSKPTLSMDEQFVVTELGDLRKRGDLLSAVLFTLMIWNENMMYSTSRDLRKMSVIDEGWKLLGGSSKRFVILLRKDTVLHVAIMVHMALLLSLFVTKFEHSFTGSL
jgi:conjugal transfer ATP-binding protein TraC